MNDRKDQQREKSLDALLEEVDPEEAARLREVWDLTADAEPAGEGPPVDTEEALGRLRQALEADGADLGASQPARESKPDPDRRLQRAPTSGRRSSGRTPSWPVATALLVLLLAGAVGIYWWQQPIVRTAPRGERLTLTLPDGSEVELNSGASIRYERSFGEVRAVHLEGEAFFTVTSDRRPFRVRTFNAEVRALGTEFNVRAWPDDPSTSTEVTLVEGRVEVCSREGSGPTIQLRPGETRRVQGSQDAPITVLDVSVGAATAWRRGDLIAKDRPLGQVLREVERRFAVELAVRPSSLRRQRINLALRGPESGEAVVRDLSRALGLKYRETSNGFMLYRSSSSA